MRLSWLQVFCILIAALFFSMHIYKTSKTSVMEQIYEKLDTLNRTSFLFNDSTVVYIQNILNKMPETKNISSAFNSIQEDLSFIDTQHHQLKEMAAETTSLLKTIDQYFSYCLNEEKERKNIHTLLSLKHVIYSSRHYMKLFVTHFEIYNLQESHQLLKECLRTFKAFILTKPAGREFISLKNLERNLENYTSYVETMMKEAHLLNARTLLVKERLSTVMNNIKTFDNTSWVTYGFMMLFMTLILSIGSRLLFNRVVKGQLNHTKTLKYMLKRAREKNYILSHKEPLFEEKAPLLSLDRMALISAAFEEYQQKSTIHQTMPLNKNGIVVSGFSLSSAALHRQDFQEECHN